MRAQKPNDLKQHNVRAIRQLFVQQQSLTQNEIARHTALSVVTANKLIGEMIQKNEVLLAEDTVATGGRKAKKYQLNKDYKHILAVQFYEHEKENTVSLTVSDLLCKVLTAQTRIFSAEAMAVFWEALAELLLQDPLIGIIVVGIPGVEAEGEFKIMDFASLEAADFRQQLQELTDLPVIFENDINAATYGYAKEQALSEIVAGIYFLENYAPGSALVFNDQIFRGANGLSGELKHLPMFEEVAFPVTEKKDVSKLVEAALRVVISMYDPQHLVVFDTNRLITEELWSFLRDKLQLVFPYDSMPELQLRHTIADPYLSGLNEIGLKKILAEEI